MWKGILKLCSLKIIIYTRQPRIYRKIQYFGKAFDSIELYEYPCDETGRITDYIKHVMFNFNPILVL